MGEKESRHTAYSKAYKKPLHGLNMRKTQRKVFTNGRKMQEKAGAVHKRRHNAGGISRDTDYNIQIFTCLQLIVIPGVWMTMMLDFQQHQAQMPLLAYRKPQRIVHPDQ